MAAFQMKHHLRSSVLFIIISFVACRSILLEDPLKMHVVDDDASANYPIIDDGGRSSNKNLIKQTTDIDDDDDDDHVLSFNRLASSSSGSSLNTVNVNDYGAQGDGSTDDTQAFKKAWQVACSSGEATTLVVPKQNYLLKPIRFSGPCKSNITMQISGVLEASDNRSDYSEDSTHWLMFRNVKKLSVQGDGSGTINGNGNIWWQNSCKKNKKLPCKNAPTAVTFYKCQDLVVEGLTIKNAQQIHVSFQQSNYIRASDLTVTAPEDSPNTDGIHVTNTQNIQISNSVIGTGDDCISIVSGSRNVQATNITCGPGHGISIGSLGAKKAKDVVYGIIVNGAKLTGTTNGVRIKTWQGGSGSASNIKFQNIEMDKVTNPIIIDQNYCDQKGPCKQQESAVEIKNVLYENIKGTSESEVGVKFDCSESVPCKGIVMHNVDLRLAESSSSSSSSSAKAECNNVQVSYIGDVNPRCP